jgi:putative peptidoglycan lipid II flippase
VARIRQGLMLSNASMLPLGALMVALAAPIVDLVYERGAFDAAAGDLVDGLLMAYGLGMAAYLGRDVLVRVFYALGDGNTPFRLSLAGIGLNAIADWVLVGGPTPWGLQLPGSNFGAAGLVLATVVVNVVTCGALLWVLHRRLGGLPLLSWARDTFWLLLAALVAGAVAWALAHGVHWPSGPLRLLLRPALSAALGLAAYGVVASSAGVPEARQMLAGLQRRLPFRFGR